MSIKKMEFDADYELLVLALCCRKKQFMHMHGRNLRPEVFNDPTNAWIFDFAQDYAKKYGWVLPNKTEFRQELKGTGDEKHLIQSRLEKMEALSLTGKDGPVGKKVAQFTAERFINIAIRKSQKLLAHRNGTDVTKQILELFNNVSKKTISQVSGRSLSDPQFLNEFMSYFEHAVNEVVPLGISALDAILKGGPMPGELVVALGATGKGKSHFCVHVGAFNFLHGKKVLHITTELNAMRTAARYYGWFTKIPSDRVHVKEMKEQLHNRMKIVQDRGGILKIEDFKTYIGARAYSILKRGIQVDDIKRMADELVDRRGVDLDIIIIDMADHLTMPGGNSDLSSGHMVSTQIFEELQQLASNYGAVVLTTVHVNRGAQEKDLITLKDTAEDINRIKKPDVVLTLNQTKAEKELKTMRCFLAKSRNCEDGQIIPLSFNSSISHFKSLSTKSQIKIPDE